MAVKYRVKGQKNNMVCIDFVLDGVTKSKLQAKMPKQSPKLIQQALIEKCLADYLKEEKLSLWRLPKLQNVQDDAKSLRFRAWITPFPMVTLPDEHQIEYQVPEFESPTEREVQEALDKFQYAFHTLTAVKRPATWGDVVTVNIYGTCEGMLIPGSALTGFSLALKPLADGTEDPIMAGLVGLNISQKKTLKFPLPDSYLFPEWRGKEAIYQLEVVEIQEIKLPPLDDTLAKHVGQPDLAHLLQSIMVDLNEKRKTQWELELRRKVVRAYVDKADVEIQEDWVNESIKQEWQQTDLSNLRIMKASVEMSKSSIESWLKQPHLKAIHYQSLKSKFVLREVLQQEEIPLTKKEVLKVLAKFAKDQTPQAFYQQMADENALGEFQDTLHLEKACDFIISKVQLMVGDKTHSVPQ